MWRCFWKLQIRDEDYIVRAWGAAVLRPYTCGYAIGKW
jgi:hypothetical protein